MKRNRSTSVDEYKQHVFELCCAFTVLVVEHGTGPKEIMVAGQLFRLDETTPPHVALAEPSSRIVFAPRLIDETTYAVQLHEIGHLSHPTGFLRATRRACLECTAATIMTEERSAWEWAEHYALEWTDLMSKIRDWALKSYESGTALRAAQHTRAAQRLLDIARGRKP